MAHDPEVIQCVLEDDRLAEPRRLAENFRERIDSGPPNEFRDSLGAIKGAAVEAGDETLAKACWCLETIGSAQDQFIAAFLRGKQDDFYGCWCALEQAELRIHFLREHFPIEDNRFGLEHINLHVPRFQALFPYKVFLSPGMVVRKALCSICNQPFKLRGGCQHVVGEIYGGKSCSRLITDVEMLEVSLVDTPVQKYSVPFGPEITYDYGTVRYILAGLRSPWHGWNAERSEIITANEGYPGTQRNERCPCNSGKKYKACCQREQRKKVHYEVEFEYRPPADLPSYLDDARFPVTGSPQGLA